MLQHSGGLAAQEAFAGGRIFIEDKGAALAVHYRLLREASEWCGRRLTPRRGASVRVTACSRRRMYSSSLPTHANKGSAVRAFRDRSAVCRTSAVFVGDDVTEYNGFEAARQLGGLGIAVGERVAAEYRLADVPAAAGDP